MENNNKFWKGVLTGALVTAFGGIVIIGVALGVYVVGKSVIQNVELNSTQIEASGQQNKLDFKKISSKMSMIQQIVDRYYLFEEDPEKIETGVYRGLMSGLDDPYSVYYSEENFKSLMENTEGVYCGIGAMVSQDITTGISTIVRVFEGSPAEAGGLLPGDIIYKITGEEVTGMELDLIVKNYIRGIEGTTVHMTVVRGDMNEEVEIDMTRRNIEVPTVEHQMLENHVGYVLVVQFDSVTTEQFKKAIVDLQSQGMEKLVIDLRNNPGGVLDSVVDMASYILPEGMILYTQDKNGKGEKYFCENGKIQCTSDKGTPNTAYPKEDNHELKIPMAVLVNGNSASASEVFTGAMKDYKWAKIVGTTTFGKGIVQNVIPLGDNTAIKLTTSHYFTPNGFDLHKKGIEPDLVVELDENLQKKVIVSLSEDNQLQAAIQVLNES